MVAVVLSFFPAIAFLLEEIWLSCDAHYVFLPPLLGDAHHHLPRRLPQVVLVGLAAEAISLSP